MGMVSFIKEKIQARKKVKEVQEVAEVEIEQEVIKQEEIVNESSPRELYMGEFLTAEEIKERQEKFSDLFAMLLNPELGESNSDFRIVSNVEDDLL